MSINFYEGISRFDFKELCDQNLGAEDYLEIVKVSDFSRPTVSSTVHEALNLKYLEKIKGNGDSRRNDYRPTKPMLDAWRNYCNALLVNPKFDHALRLAQTVILSRESESQSSKENM